MYVWCHGNAFNIFGNQNRRIESMGKNSNVCSDTQARPSLTKDPLEWLCIAFLVQVTNTNI